MAPGLVLVEIGNLKVTYYKGKSKEYSTPYPWLGWGFLEYLTVLQDAFSKSRACLLGTLP